MRANLFIIFLTLCFSLKNAYAGTEGEWLRVSHGEVPSLAFAMDNKIYPMEEQTFICRAPQGKAIYPGYLIPRTNECDSGNSSDSKGVCNSRNVCILNVAGREVKAVYYEVLIGDSYKWQVFPRTYVDKIPQNAVLGGTEDPQYDRSLYICRTKNQQKEWVIGKLSNPLRGCQINHNNREQSGLDFEILVKSE